MRQRDEQMTVALAGNPNVGKSTLFNALTGLHQHTGNWPGKTVGMVTGTAEYRGKRIRLVDLPGTYSLTGKSEDEKVASDYIGSEQADCVVAVSDGSCLERTLILALQILKKTKRVVLCVNLMDEAERRGLCVDAAHLERLIGIPVVLTSAGRGKGLNQLLEKVLQNLPGQEPEMTLSDPIADAERIAALCVHHTDEEKDRWRIHLDRLLVSRRHGMLILMAVLLGIIWLTVWGANYPSRLLEMLFDSLYRVLIRWTSGLPWWLSGVLVDGVYGTTARVIAVMLPPMLIFFPLFTILEDIGYLPRMAFLLDHGMCCCGGCGKQALTLCMGLGCNAVGVMGCRIIDSPRERLMAILTNSMVPCNGRFPTLILLGSLFFPNVGAALIVAVCIVLGVMGAMGVSGVLSKTALKHRDSTFILEIPPFRRPRVGQILIRSLLDRTAFVAGRALMVAAPAGVVLWVLTNLSVLGSISSFLDPVGKILGMNGVILLGFVLSIPANELLIPVIFMILSGADLQNAAQQGADFLIRSGWTWQTAVCTMVFTLFHWPCATTLLTVYKETGSAAKTAAAFILPTAVGFTLCAMLHLVL